MLHQEGDRVRWSAREEHGGTWWYLLVGGDDQWVRVKYVDTVRHCRRAAAGR